MNKILYCIRHGESIHYKQFLKYGSGSYYNKLYRDSRLTKNGHEQSNNLSSWNKINEIDLVITSPQYRALQTTSNIFQNQLGSKKIIALESVREYPLSFQTCNQRSKKSLLKKDFIHINFDNIKTEEDNIWSKDKNESLVSFENRVGDFLNFIKNRPEKNICLVGHNLFINKLVYNKIMFDIEEINRTQCLPQKVDLKKIYNNLC
jgi:broad specificity phosphatase PhoE